MTIPGITVPMNKKTIIPDPEKHLSFSTKMVVLAIELYQEEAPRDICHYTTFAYRKLKQFVDDRKDMTAQSYRFFVEHAYNQFFQHEAFHQSARARTKAKDLNARDFHTSTKLSGYVWVASSEKLAHVPKDQADDVNMEGPEEDDEAQFLPSLHVVVRPQEKDKADEGVGSLQKEETPQHGASSDDDDVVSIDLAQINRPEDRYGCFIVRQLKREHQSMLRDLCINSQVVLQGDDLEGGPPLRRETVGYFSLLFFMEFVADTSLTSFLEDYASSTQAQIQYDTYHEFHLEVKRVFEANKQITVDNFENVEEPDLNDDDPNIPLQRREDQGRGDPEFKGKLENLSKVDKHLILETEDDALVECTIQWLSMYNKTVQQKMMERVVKPETKDEEEEVEVEAEQQEPQEPTVPAPTSSEMECQTDESFLMDSKAGSSLKKEAPVPPEGSSQKEESGETKAEEKKDIQKDDTAPKQEPAKRLYYDADITGNEDDLVFRKLADCFKWAGF